MTWSIVAFDADTGAFAVVVATKNFAVGATVPHLRAGIISDHYGPRDRATGSLQPR